MEKKNKEVIDLNINLEDEKVFVNNENTEIAYAMRQEAKQEAVKKWENKECKKSLVEDTNCLEDARKSREFVNTGDDKILHPAIVTDDETKQIHKEIESYRKYKERCNKPATFSDILDEMDALHTKKNTDYGDVWHREIAEFGPLPGVIRLWEKVERLKSLNKNGRALVGDESFEDTLLDIANYAVMTLVEMRNLNK